MIKTQRKIYNYNINFSISDPEPNISIEIMSNPHPCRNEKIIEVEDFPMTQIVKERMAMLCGATNFSLALRNSEHAAR